jgi:hypothetical protein
VKRFAGYQFARILEEAEEDLNRLTFQPDLAALFLEFARSQIELEDPESYEMRAWRRGAHGIERW